MDKESLLHFKKLLESEKEKLLGELAGLGRKNPENQNDWEATYSPHAPIGADDSEQEPDPNDRADEIEGYEQRKATLDALEGRLYNVRKSLQKITDGRYGICIVDKEKKHLIEMDRLEANPAARTCKSHLDHRSQT